MKLDGVLSIIEEYAPIKLSYDFQKMVDGYDNSGVLAGVDGEITGVLFTLDLTEKSVEKAVENGCNLIVTHHPAIYAPIKVVDGALLKCIQAKIGVISMHLNLDCAKEGIDYYLANGLGATEQKILFDLGSGCGYGRTFDFNGSLLQIKQKYQLVFETDNVMIFGSPDKKIKTIASFCGSGLDVKEIEMVKDADLFISSDIKHHVILYALEKGKCVMNVSHYSSEVYGYKKFFENIKQKLNGLNCVFYENADML